MVESLATWRIADPEHFLRSFTSQAAAEQLLGDVILAEIGSVIGHYPASDLITPDPADSRYRPIVPKFYEFLRTLQAYDKILDDKTTLFFHRTLKSYGYCILMRNRRRASRRRMGPRPSAPPAHRRNPAQSRPMPIGS